MKRTLPVIICVSLMTLVLSAGFRAYSGYSQSNIVSDNATFLDDRIIETSDDRDYRVLSKTGDSSIITQQAFSKANTIYEIRDVFDLNGKKIIIPNNCVLKFEGGKLKNGTIVFNSSIIEGSPSFDNLELYGTIQNDRLINTWFGIAQNDTKTNNDKKWNTFIQASRELGVKAFILEGEYSLFSQLNLTAGTVIIGVPRKTTLWYRGSSNSSCFFVTGANHLENLILRRPQDTRMNHQAIGIRIGDAEKKITSTASRFINLECHHFYIGMKFEYCWNNMAHNIETDWNVYGVYHNVTECHITHLFSSGNVVGVYTGKLKNNLSDTPNLRICFGTVEGNGIGGIFECGDVNLIGLYLEGNVPSKENKASNYHFSDDYESGCDILCGTGDNYVTSFTLDNCYLGHSEGRYSSLYYIDKCSSLNIIGTVIPNLVYTDHTTVNHCENGRDTHLSGNFVVSTTPSFNTASEPCIFVNRFSSNKVDALNRMVFGGGLAILGYKYASYGDYVKLFTESQNKNGRRIGFAFESSYLTDGIYTIVASVKMSTSLKKIEVTDADGTKDWIIGAYTNKDNIYVVPFKVVVKKGAGAAYLTLYNDASYVANNEDNGISLYNLSVYPGVVYNLNYSNNYTNIITESTIVKPNKILYIPSDKPGGGSYGQGPDQKSIPAIRFDKTTHRLIIRCDGVDYEYDPDKIVYDN